MPCLHDTSLTTPTPEAVRAAIEDATNRIVAGGERMTEPRRRVLELLLTASRPVKAYDLIAQFHPESLVAKPPTVYRALEFLEGIGLLHRISSLSSYVACTGKWEPHSPAFLLCRCCGASLELTMPVESVLAEEAAARGYSVTHVTLEVQGACPACHPSHGD